MNKLQDRVAIITGGSRGIGSGIATAMAEAGAAVAVNYRHDSAAAQETVAGIIKAGGRALAVQADVSQRADVQELFARTAAEFGTVDILVNNAAVYSFQPLEEITEGEFRRQYDTNVLGPILTLQEYLKQAPAQGGSVVNVVTAGISANGPGSALYTSTKGALTTVTKTAANELGARGIRVNAIAPGATDTEGARELGLLGGDMVEQLISSTPLGRIGYPEDIGPVAVFLASDDARWITGDVIFAAGGWY